MILNKRHRAVWRYCIGQLKKNFNPGVPVIVRTIELGDRKGDCEGIMGLKRLTSIKIRIDSLMAIDFRIECLVHEWAHAMDWPGSWRDDSLSRVHNEVWGVWYAKIYQHIFDRCWEEMGNLSLLTKKQLKSFPLDEYKWTAKQLKSLACELKAGK